MPVATTTPLPAFLRPPACKTVAYLTNLPRACWYHERKITANYCDAAMLTDDTYTSYFLDTLIGAAIFFVLVAGGTYYLQSSLVLYKHYGAHIHWVGILIALPVIAGIVMRLTHIIYPLISAILGAAASAALLYPLYKSFWAEPPTLVDLTIYVVAVLGIGFIASQPLRTTVMVAFRLGRFSIAKLPQRQKPVTAGKKKPQPTRKASMSSTQRLQASSHGNVIAMMELFVGLSSLALSIFSVFFLGRS